MIVNKIRTYSELSKLKTFEERLEYLKLSNNVADETFGFDRYLNQQLYTSSEWKKVRDCVIVRDNGCDLGIEGYEIKYGKILVHHMNPITKEDIIYHNQDIFNPDYLITLSLDTHNEIHYGLGNNKTNLPKERSTNDMCPWKH